MNLFLINKHGFGFIVFVFPGVWIRVVQPKDEFLSLEQDVKVECGPHVFHTFPKRNQCKCVSIRLCEISN